MRATRIIPLALLAGCAVGPNYEAPRITLPESWSEPLAAGLTGGDVATEAWWRKFDDPMLGDLVERALRQNLDLRSAFARLRSARALRGVADAGRFPTIDANASYEHSEASVNTPFGAFIPNTDIHTVSFDASWEVDLWGRVRRDREAALGDLQASEAELQAAALTVAAEVARTYVDLRSAQRRQRIANDNLQLQLQTLDVVLARRNAGLVVERDVAQARTNVEQTRARLPQLQTETARFRNRLAVLLGGTPDRLPEGLSGDAGVPGLPDNVGVGAPVELLLRRPDVRRAERQLAAAVARVGVAEADRYPRLLLSGRGGLQSDGGDNLLDVDSLFFAVGPSVRWTLFDGGRLKNRARSFEAQAEAAHIAYEQAILLAIEETENAMTGFVREQARRDSLVSAAGQARRAVELAQTQYQEGLADFQAVLDSQRIVASIEDEMAVSTATVATNLIALFKALGGGFDALPDGDGESEED